jgi:hypothetical protein
MRSTRDFGNIPRMRCGVNVHIDVNSIRALREKTWSAGNWNPWSPIGLRSTKLSSRSLCFSAYDAETNPIMCINVRLYLAVIQHFLSNPLRLFTTKWMSQQSHLLNTHCLSPAFQAVYKIGLSLYSIASTISVSSWSSPAKQVNGVYFVVLYAQSTLAYVQVHPFDNYISMHCLPLKVRLCCVSICLCHHRLFHIVC